ncbi:MAG: hypothetical protein AAFO04_24065 [Cyanobacteria bacterium J06592_8]
MAPISGGGGSSLSNEIIQKLIDGLSNNRGVPAYRYSKVVEGEVQNKTLVVPATAQQVLREVWIKNLSEFWVTLYWADDQIDFIPPDGFYSDAADGGIELSLESLNLAKIKITLRSEQPIDYELFN